MPLHELDIRKKPILGSGAFHNVYDYALSKGKVIKTKQHGDLDLNEIKLFEQNPQFCAKVYKYTDKYAILEKLNTTDFREDNDKISQGIWRFIYTNPNISDEELPYFINIQLTDATDIDASKFIWTALGHKLGKPSETKEATLKKIAKYCPQPLYNDWITWFKTLDKDFKGRSSSYLDVHEYNLGYNKEGELRLLDI